MFSPRDLISWNTCSPAGRGVPNADPTVRHRIPDDTAHRQHREPDRADQGRDVAEKIESRLLSIAAADTVTTRNTAPLSSGA